MPYMVELPVLNYDFDTIAANGTLILNYNFGGPNYQLIFAAGESDVWAAPYYNASDLSYAGGVVGSKTKRTVTLYACIIGPTTTENQLRTYTSTAAGNYYNIHRALFITNAGECIVPSSWSSYFTSESQIAPYCAANGFRVFSDNYPITYRLTNCTAPNAPTEASGGSEVVINITPSQGYILRSSGVSVVDSNGVSVPYILQGNQIMFTMPYEP